ncbi:MAG: hypothetical protein NVS1B13_22460 [Flavisolibacter sp.]
MGKYYLNENDATRAIREMLDIGVRDETMNPALSKQRIMSTIFPESIRKTLNTLQQLGLTNQIDKFTTDLTMASQRAASKSIPVFVRAIDNLSFRDAIQIIKGGQTAATDYLRAAAGTDVRLAIRPVMKESIDQYHLENQWETITKPIKSVVGDRLNLDLSNLMAGIVSESMFDKIAAKEKQIREQESARNSTLLHNVFSRRWH